MTDKPKRDHWSELANKVGAETTSDGGDEREPSTSDDDVQSDSVASARPAGEVSDAASNAEPDQTESNNSSKPAGLSQKEARPHKAPASRAKSGWDDLADQFDLPLPDKPVAMQAEPLAETAAADDAVSRDEPLAQPPEDLAKGHLGEEDSREDKTAVASSTEQFDALFCDPRAAEELGATSVPCRDAGKPSFAEDVAAVSPEPPAKRSSREKKDGRRRKSQRRQAEAIDVDKAFGDEDADGPDRERLEGDKAAGRDESGADDRKRGKRRRRRGSRRRKDSQQTVVEESLNEVEDALEERIVEEPQRRTSQQDRGDTEDDNRRKERRQRKEDNSGDEKKKISHRGIPTWDEAIEHVIAANLEKRSKKPAAGSQSRSKGGRGRSGRARSNSRKRPG